MPVRLTDFKTPVVADGGATYYARACGSLRADGMWEGWVEFREADGRRTLRSARETSQPNLTDVEYWATGLTPVYLEGTLKRTLAHAKRQGVPKPVHDRLPLSHPPSPIVPAVGSVLDPYAIYEARPDLLLQALGALSRPHLLNIIRAYALVNARAADLGALSKDQLADLIVLRVTDRAGR